MKMTATDAIGRAYRYTYDELLTIILEMGYVVSTDEYPNTPDLARLINRRCSHGTPHYLANLRTLRRVSGFPEAKAVHVRGWITNGRNRFAAKL